MSKNLKEERIGETRKNIESLGNYEMKIIEYNSNRSVIIEFQDNYKAKITTNYPNFKNGKIKKSIPSKCL